MVGNVIKEQLPPPPRRKHTPAPCYRRTWGRTEWPAADQAALFTSAIANNTANISSDGSVKVGHGTTGWTFAIQTGLMTCDEIQRGAAPVDCDPSDQSSTRCKLSRILAGIMAIENVTLGKSRGIITAGCDSAGAISGIRHWTRTRQATRRMQGGANADLIREIRAVLKRPPNLTMAWLNVKAHLKRPPESAHGVF